MKPHDVAVVGAGVVGAAIALRLSRDGLRILWLEAASAVGRGASDRNSGIACSGWDANPGTLEAELVLASSPRWELISASLGVPFRRVGLLVLAFGEETAELGPLLERAQGNGVEASVVDGAELRRLAPAASPHAAAALHIPAEGIVDSKRLVAACAEAAVRDGVDLRLSTPATAFTKSGERITHVVTPRGALPVGYVVNAAGLYADAVSAAAGAEEFRVWARKGQYLLADAALGAQLTTILAPVPTEQTRGVLAIPRLDGTALLGPTAQDCDDKEDRGTDEDVLAQVFARAARLLPALERRHVTGASAGRRPASDRTYRVERSDLVPNLVHAAAIRSTGVSSSPAVADRVRALLADAGCY